MCLHCNLQLHSPIRSGFAMKASATNPCPEKKFNSSLSFKQSICHSIASLL